MGGDEWFGGMTRNPWNPSEGALGSSAGPGSAVAAGCIAFALGSETLDSISAPCTRCGATGLRPTFGRVPRTGCMALVWSMDKIGPVARTVEDCALVLEAVNGADSRDVSSRTVPFGWDVDMNVSSLRVGFLQGDFSGERAGISGIPEAAAVRAESEQIDRAALDVIRGLGVQLIPVELPQLPWRAMLAIPKAEAAAAFEEMTRTGRDQLLPWQQKNWPNVFRIARFIPAVEYINANRLRRLGMDAMAGLFRKVDVIIAPTNSVQLIVTNLTGHPAVIVPNGFRSNGSPTSLTFLGDEFQEGRLLALAHSYQRATRWHLQHPAWLDPSRERKHS
jgi:Asp-tRNA(Asn)/Glu-tRNA(Gln) amidotransferase A subunit family amidase